MVGQGTLAAEEYMGKMASFLNLRKVPADLLSFIFQGRLYTVINRVLKRCRKVPEDLEHASGSCHSLTMVCCAVY